MDTATLRKAVLVRKFEQKLLDLFSEGKLNGTVHTCVGQELIPVVIADYVTPDDMVFSNHRGHGHFIAHCGREAELMQEILGRRDGVSSGIGGSQHLRADNFLSNGIQGGLAPVAAGHAFANTNGISVCYVGDGTLGEGQFYEALVLSGIFSSQVMYVIENNGYAQSTKTSSIIKGGLKARFEGFGLSYYCADVWDLDNLSSVVQKAVDNTRKGNPTILEVDCYRLNSHSKGDDNRFEEEIEAHKVKDLINGYAKENPQEYSKIESEIDTYIAAMLATISEKSEPDVSFRVPNPIVFKEVANADYSIEKNKNIRTNQLINNGLAHILEGNACLIGEDICDTTVDTPHIYGGAFKVTSGLSTKFPEKVFNTSISEAGIVGFGLGVALFGRQAVVEIMFGDFLTLVFDQILQQVSKMKFMFGGEIEIPLIIRSPMGARRGYGPTHSQNIEKYFLFIPGVNCLALNCLSNPESVYRNVAKERDFFLVIEDKVSYTRPLLRKPIAGYRIFESEENFPTHIISPSAINPNLIIFVYGAMVEETISVLEDLILEDIIPQIVSPTSLSPINLSQLVSALNKTKNLIFIEEGSRYTSLSSEIIAQLTELKVDFNLLGRISNEEIIPCDKRREAILIPSASNLAAKIIGVFDDN